MKLLAYANSSGSEIAHIKYLSRISGGLRKETKFTHIVDRTSMTPNRMVFTQRGFKFDPNSSRAAKKGLGIFLSCPEHELAQLVFTGMKAWRFQHRGEIFNVTFERVLDDVQIKCGDSFVYVDIAAMLSSLCPYHSQFRGRLLILINSHKKHIDQINKKRLALLENSGYFVLLVNLPAALCSEGKLGFSPARNKIILDGLRDRLSEAPEVKFLTKPGWFAGERATDGVVHNDPMRYDAGALSFGNLRRKPSMLERWTDKANALLDPKKSKRRR